eukprot:6773792-Prorocentrum_lima.AAC.1
MTSSLVGSEMCIRDRRKSPSKRGIPDERPSPCARSAAAHCRPSNMRDAVSYTHLTLPTICSV